MKDHETSTCLPFFISQKRSCTTPVCRTAPKLQVVYVDGAWDMFHCGHVALLREAKALGDLLIVGVHADAVPHWVEGPVKIKNL